MVVINPYLNFNGNAEEAFNFYKSIFGGEVFILRFKDSPEAGNVSEADKEKAMHINLPLSKSNVLMATDMTGNRPFKPGNNFSLSVGTDTEQEATKIFNGLAEGGQIILPLSKQFWGALFGMVNDKFGVHWMVSYDESAKPS